MNRTGDQFFAGPAFTCNQNIRAVSRHLLNQMVNLFDSDALADDTLEMKIRIVNSSRPLLQVELPRPAQLVLKSEFLLNLFLLTDVFEDRHITDELFACVAQGCERQSYLFLVPLRGNKNDLV